ncbi:MAG: phage holin family protein [Patescibacteria group bacterium]
MKKVLRHYVIDTFILFVVSKIASGLVFENGVETLLLAGAGLTVASLLAKPVINLLLLPLNLITFNLFKWVSSAVALYLVTLVVPGFKITEFFFGGLSSQWLDLPSLSFTGFFVYVAYSFIFSVFAAFIYWII